MNDAPNLAAPRNPLDDDGMGNQEEHMPAPQAPGTNVTVQGGIITAQRCEVKRNRPQIQNTLKILAAMNGDSYIYRWMAKNRQKNTMEEIKGPTIKLAQDLAREWGNCMVDCRVEDMGDHFMLYGRFVDYETGYSFTRPFKQRKGQNTGMADGGRMEDLILQIGASKCIRNVIVNVLGSFATNMVAWAEGSILARIEKAPDDARAYLVDRVGKFDIELKRVERVLGRTAAEWRPVDMAKIYASITAIEDDMTTVDDIWPKDIDDAEDIARAEAGQKASETRPQGSEETQADRTEGEEGTPATENSKLPGLSRMTMVQAVTELATHGIVPDGAIGRDDLIELVKKAREGGHPVDVKERHAMDEAEEFESPAETENPKPQADPASEEREPVVVPGPTEPADKGPDTSELDGDDDLQFE